MYVSVANYWDAGCRFDPKNMHQCPQVVVLCGPGSQAAFAVNCARQLASRRIHLTVFIPDSARCSDGMEVEMKLLDLNGAKLTTSDYNSELHFTVFMWYHYSMSVRHKFHVLKCSLLPYFSCELLVRILFSFWIHLLEYLKYIISDDIIFLF